MQMQVMGSKTWGRVPCLQEPQQGAMACWSLQVNRLQRKWPPEESDA